MGWSNVHLNDKKEDSDPRIHVRRTSISTLYVSSIHNSNSNIKFEDLETELPGKVYLTYGQVSISTDHH